MRRRRGERRRSRRSEACQRSCDTHTHSRQSNGAAIPWREETARSGQCVSCVSLSTFLRSLPLYYASDCCHCSPCECRNVTNGGQRREGERCSLATPNTKMEVLFDFVVVLVAAFAFPFLVCRRRRARLARKGIGQLELARRWRAAPPAWLKWTQMPRARDGITGSRPVSCGPDD